ncbi:MAG: magnesium transporter [Myxococcota bacterium]
MLNPSFVSAAPTAAGAQDRLQVQAAWADLDRAARVEAFTGLARPLREELFHALSTHDQAELLSALPPREQRWWLRALDPDDAADLIQHLEQDAGGDRAELLALLDPAARREVTALLAYAEDAAGGLMNPRFSTVRADATVDEALAYLRQRARHADTQAFETTYYVYVLEAQRPVGVLSIRRLLAAGPGLRVRDVMHRELVTVPDTLDQEAVARIFADEDLLALPVVDAEGRMKGIITADDIVDVVREEATEDLQKFGGMEALDAPYLRSRLSDLIQKRAGWLSLLLVGEMLTTSAMGYFEHEIQQLVVLALFVPLIISSGGNSGSQASTLVIRAMALGEVRLTDGLRVARREIAAGAALGLTLGVIGFLRVILWQALFHTYGDQAMGVAATVATSLFGVVMFGCLSGAMLPFALKRAGLDPASASAPFVATLVDVTGIVIYFSAASFWLGLGG